MTKRLPPLTDDLKQISECSLYRDPRVSKRARLHTFCGECKETATINQDSCPLCRPFSGIPEVGCGSIPKDYVKEQLVDLHQEYLEKKLNLKDEKVIDIPLIEKFNLSDTENQYSHMSWLENKIYILYQGSKTIHVFTDQAPFDELMEAIQIPGLGKPLSMLANAVSRAIFISDGRGYIYKIQMPNGKISRWKARSIDHRSGHTTKMSNSTVLGNCLLTSFLYKASNAESKQYELQLFSQRNGGLQTKCVFLLTKKIKYIGHVVHTSEHSFVISYSKTLPFTQIWIAIFSSDGRRARTFDPKLFGSVIKNLGPFRFDIDDDGRIFIADTGGNNVICLNSNLTDYRIISQTDREIEYPCNIVYIPEKRQLLVQKRRRVVPVGFLYSIYVFHLSPCNLIQQLK